MSLCFKKGGCPGPGESTGQERKNPKIGQPLVCCNTQRNECGGDKEPKSENRRGGHPGTNLQEATAMWENFHTGPKPKKVDGGQKARRLDNIMEGRKSECKIQKEETSTNTHRKG